MIDADHAVAILAIVAALVLLAWGIRRHLSQEDTQLSAQPRPLVTYDVADEDDWTDSDRYHGSRQWGRS